MNYYEAIIGGKLRGITFSPGTNILLQGSPVAKMDEDERKAFGLPYVLWAGLKTDCAINGRMLTKTIDVEGKPEEVAVTVKDVFDWYDELPKEVVNEIAALYAEVNAINDKPEEQPEVPEEEKKSNLEITEPTATDLPES